MGHEYNEMIDVLSESINLTPAAGQESMMGKN